ncbi:MAG: TaqI-like C-terminal specificity domain-containing protein [Terracidiphilus sp.]
MNRSQARAFVSDTFTHGFDKARFRTFVQNLLNHFDESKAAQWNQQYVKDAFKDHVQKFERLGTFTSPNRETLDVLIVHLTADSKLERARTSIRNFVADHLKQRDEKDAALVAFVSPSESSWRFSYIRMEYATVQTETGKVGVEARLTPARRFSYIVGEGESCHTAQSRFLNLLANDSTDPALAQIEEAFSVEAVTKEFFEKYAELFGDIHAALEKLAAKNKAIRDEFASKGVQTVDFAKKLMGQIVFLYFLQKKGWLGVERGKPWGTGPHDLLRKMASGAYGEYKNFFNDILEPLFYNTLATDRGHEAWCDLFKCRIPFLNGGLFEPLGDYDWRTIDIPLPNELFTNNKHIEEGITGSGVLDVFDRYNFTVNEAEPLEQEVAIDPEMLGKVFENLIEENRRKGLGAFYTPREIVHYMCQESLVNYLDAALNKDSQLIPRADIETLVHLGEQISHYEAVEAKYVIKMPTSVQQSARHLDEKLADITVCDPAVGSGAFPVGMMAEIVRSRSALTPYFNDVQERTAYHFKRHAIQSCLYGVDVDPGAVEIAKLRLWLSLVVDEEETNQIKPLPNLDFKIVHGNSLLSFPYQSRGLHEVEVLKEKYFQETNHERKTAIKQAIAAKISECLAASKKTLGYEIDFDFKTYFSEVFDRKGGFDVVIANPPYVDSERMTLEQPTVRAKYAQIFTTAKGNWDLFIVFIEQGVRQLSSRGVISYICPNKLVGAPYAESLRALLLDHAVMEIRDYSSVNVFKEAAVYPVVFRIRMDTAARCDPRMTVMSDLEQVRRTRTVPMDLFYADTSWDRYFGTEVTFDILIKVGAHPPLELHCKEVTSAATVSEAYEIKEVVRESSSSSAKYFRRLVNTGTIDRFVFLWGEQPTRYIKASYSEPIVLDSDLRAISRKRYEQSVAPKIVIGGMTRVLECALDVDGEYLAGKSTTIVLDDDLDHLKFLLGILNSSVVSFWYQNYYKSLSLAGGYLRINQREIKSVPIPRHSEGAKRDIVTTVDKIIAAKRKGAACGDLEASLDEQIAVLYGLTSEEVLIVNERRLETTHS